MVSLLLSPSFVHLFTVVCVCVLFISSLVPPTLDYAEQLRVMQKTKDKLELALEKHQDCTYLLSPPVSLLLPSVTLRTSFLLLRR